MMTANSTELLQIADTVAREKGIEREEVIAAMEMAIQKAGRTKYGYEHDIRAHIDRSSGEIALSRYREVVEVVEDEITQLTLDEAKRIKSNAELGEFIVDALPPIDFGRVAAQTARQVIIQKVREAERERQFKEFQNRQGEVINGLVKRVEFGNVFVDLGRAEGLLRREETIPRETIKVGDRIRCYIMEVRNEPHGSQIFLSRTHPQFMAELFRQEVPEIYDGVIVIKAAARDPGSRAKIAVYTNDHSLDPVGACVGMRGSRVQAVVGEMHGEKIDIVPWSSDIATFTVNALAPAEVSRVVVEEDENRIQVIVPDDQQSLAIGRRGQNVRLAAQLTGWQIDIATESSDSERRTTEMETLVALFTKALDVDEVIARLLATEGFSSVEEIAYVELDELTSIEGFDEDVASELQKRAKDFLEEQEKEDTEHYQELGVSEELANLEGLTPKMLSILGENKIKTLDDLADLAGDELLELLVDCELTLDEANDMIMEARAHWFEDDHKPITNEVQEIEE
jgi:transcription termination/antitermination protein NusA